MGRDLSIIGGDSLLNKEHMNYPYILHANGGAPYEHIYNKIILGE